MNGVPAGDVAIGFAAVGPNIWAGAYYALRRAGEIEFRTTATLAAGTGNSYAQSQGGRLGDYTGTVVDPVNDNRFWLYNEYDTAPTQGTVSWATRVGTFSATPVVNRAIFYNGSHWDGDDFGANPSDDLAVAPDKQALLPGESATFANYTSYFRGINGVMLDVKGLAANATLGPSDFEFRVGNSSGPVTWGLGPNPTGVTIRRGAGFMGTDRVTLIWDNYAIQKQWLQVTLKANATKGIPEADKFYFGNLISEVGDTSTNGWVSAVDLGQTKAAERPGVLTEIINRYDHNRDGYVDTADEDLVRQNQLTRLYLLAANET